MDQKINGWVGVRGVGASVCHPQCLSIWKVRVGLTQPFSMPHHLDHFCSGRWEMQPGECLIHGRDEVVKYFRLINSSYPSKRVTAKPSRACTYGWSGKRTKNMSVCQKVRNYGGSCPRILLITVSTRSWNPCLASSFKRAARIKQKMAITIHLSSSSVASAVVTHTGAVSFTLLTFYQLNGPLFKIVFPIVYVYICLLQMSSNTKTEKQKQKMFWSMDVYCICWLSSIYIL